MLLHRVFEIFRHSGVTGRAAISRQQFEFDRTSGGIVPP